MGFLVLCAGASASAETLAPDPADSQAVNSVETIIQDMRLPHEGAPHGVPRSYSWARTPRMGTGANPRSFTVMTAWGQLYEEARGNPAANTRVHIRKMRAYLLSKRSGRWRLVQSTMDVEGAAYREDYAGNDNVPAATRPEPGGGLSVQAGHGRNFHFWPSSGRVGIAREDIAGVFVTVQARLVLDDPAKPDDRDQARYLLSVGGDYWLSKKAAWFFWKTNRGIAMGRFKYVQSGWGAFNMTTLSPDELRRNPPPLE